MNKFATATALAGLAFAGSTAQAESIKDVLVDLAQTYGYIGTQAKYDFNDISISTDTDFGAIEPNDVIEGVFTISSVSLTTLGGSFVGETILATTDVEIFGRFTFTVDTVSPAAITTSSALFQIYEDDRDTVLTTAGTTGSVAYAAWASEGTEWAQLDIASGGSYTLQPQLNGDAAILPNLNIVAAGLGINDADLGVTGNVTGTGTVSPTATEGEYTDRASFTLTATVLPTPTAALGGLMIGGLALLRRR